ncbi:MAG: proprotein convertase P-domain-containing protein [Myxococcota bacterium]
MTIFTHRSKALGVVRSMAFALLLALPGVAFAAVPKLIDVHGGLYAVGGGPISDGAYQMTFSIYPSAIGSSAAYVEGPTGVTVKNGVFQYTLGTKASLSADTLAKLTSPYLAIQVGTDPEFTKLPMTSVPYALRSSVSDSLGCTGCLKATHLAADVLAPYAKTDTLAKVATSGAYADVTGAPDLTAYAKTAGLAKVATTGAYADVSGTPDLAIYAKAASLAKVAVSGAYADLTGVPDLAGYAKAADLATVATTNSYNDLAGAPAVAQVGQSCGTGLLVAGFLEDGSLDCVQTNITSVLAANLPKDGLDEVSNNLLTNVFAEKISGTPNLPIPDNTPVGATDTVEVGDIGIVQTFTVSINLLNSDLAKIQVTLYDPAGAAYVLYNKSSFGTTLKTSYPDPTSPASGDLTTWIGKNPKGKWYLKVVDSGKLDGNIDGKVTAWSLNFQVISGNKVGVSGSATVVGNATVAGSITVGGSILGLPKAKYRFAVWDCYDHGSGWFMNNDGELFGGVAPSTWCDSNPNPSDMSSAKVSLATLFSEKGYAKFNTLVTAQMWRKGNQIGSTEAKRAGALFRVKNTTGSGINWPLYWVATSYQGWGERSALMINGNTVWTGSDCYVGCTASAGLTIPANRTSTVIFIAGTGPESCGSRALMLGFYNDSLNMPNGLELVDDLDTATGGWEQ